MRSLLPELARSQLGAPVKIFELVKFLRSEIFGPRNSQQHQIPFSFPSLLFATETQHSKCDPCVCDKMKSAVHLINTCCKYSVIPKCQGGGCEREEGERAVQKKKAD